MGRDKAFLEIDGVPLWRRQLELLHNLQPSETFIAGPGEDSWLGRGITVLPDVRENAGPLSGLLAAFRQCSTDTLLALAVDLPHMTDEYLRVLLGSATSARGVVPFREGRFEPLAAVYPIAARRIAEEQVVSLSFSLQAFVRRCVETFLVSAQPVSSFQEALFFNLNTPSDLEDISKPR